MRILVRFQQNSTAPLQDTKKSVLIDSPLDRQNDRAFDSDDGAARVSSISPIYLKGHPMSVLRIFQQSFHQTNLLTLISKLFSELI